MFWQQPIIISLEQEVGTFSLKSLHLTSPAPRKHFSFLKAGDLHVIGKLCR